MPIVYRSIFYVPTYLTTSKTHNIVQLERLEDSFCNKADIIYIEHEPHVQCY